MYIHTNEIKEEDLQTEERPRGTSHIIGPIFVQLMMAVILFLKNQYAVMEYLYALIVLLLGTSLVGTYVYNRNGNMKLFSSFVNLTTIGTAFQILVDHQYNPPNSFSLLKLVIAAGIGIVFVLVYQLFRKLLNRSFMIYLMMMVAAVIYIVLISYGNDPNGYGTTAWIYIHGYSVQLTDVSKIAAVLFYGALFTNDEKRSDKELLILSSVFFFINLIGSILIKELGSFFILFFLHLSILFIFMRRGMHKRIYLIAVFLCTIGGVGLVFILYKMMLPAHNSGTMSALQTALWPYINKIHTRFSITANINLDPYGAGYQLLQAKKALWMAGWFGNTVNFTAIPVVESDMAYIGVINSFGHLMGVFIILQFMRILVEGSRLSRKLMKKDKADSIVVYGATVLLFLQAMIVILGSSNMIPFTGLPIPFLSRGYTYQTLAFCFIGVLLHMSEQSVEEEEGEAYEQ